jgi:hypothetical protein
VAGKDVPAVQAVRAAKTGPLSEVHRSVHASYTAIGVVQAASLCWEHVRVCACVCVRGKH